MATKKTVMENSPSKKEYKKDLAGKIESVLPDLKTKLGDKEFQHRIKKAAKMLAQGLHNKKEVAATNEKPKAATKKVAKKIKVAKKVKAKKQKPVAAAD